MAPAQPGGRTRLGAQWRKAPLVLRHHPTVLLAVAAAAFLVGLAAATSPFVRAAAGSVALKNKLAEFSPYVAGLEITSNEYRRPAAGFVERSLRGADAREATVDGLGRSLGFIARPLTAIELGDPVSVSTESGLTQVVVFTRTGALAHVTKLSQVAGEGVWISSIAAGQLKVKAGGSFRLTPSGYFGGGRTGKIVLRVKGIYRALAYESEKPYWNNFRSQIFTADLDSPPPPGFLFTDRRGVYDLARRLGGTQVTSVYELPVDPKGLTLDGARALARRFAAVEKELAAPRGARAGKLDCSHQLNVFALGCQVSSSLPSAITIADSDVSAVTPVVRLLSALAIGIAFAVAAAAGVFSVRRRRVEAALSFSRGEHVAAFSARTLLEALLATVTGGAAGFALAYGLTGSFAPNGTLNGTTFRAGAWQASAAVAGGLCLLTLTAALAYLRLYDTGLRTRRRPRWLVWELPLLAVAIYLLVDLRHGGGLARSGTSDSQHPTLAVFVFPLLLVAAVTGLVVRLVRLALRRGPGGGLPVAPYLALRRLGAARGLLVVLAVVSAVSFGAFFYAQALADSLAQTTEVKAYTANGSDVAALVQASEVLPRGFPYPVTKVVIGHGSGAVNNSIGQQLDVLLVDPHALPSVLHWQSEWGADPTAVLKELADSPGTPMPVIATADVGSMHAISLQGTSVPVRLLATVRSFPGHSTAPMVITSYAAFEAATRKAHVLGALDITQTYVWAKGPPDDVARALDAAHVETYFLTTVDDFRESPDVTLATRTYSYLRTIAMAAGVLVLVALLLYLQARQRSQTIASALGRRMGLSGAAETVSLCLEVAGILLFSGVVGAAVAIAAAQPVVKKIDPLPDWPPTPLFVIPWSSILIAAGALVVLALVTGLVTSRLARRADVSEALRVA